MVLQFVTRLRALEHLLERMAKLPPAFDRSVWLTAW